MLWRRRGHGFARRDTDGGHERTVKLDEGRYLSLDQGDVPVIKEHLGMVGPGIVWSLDWNGWAGYIVHLGACMLLYQTGTREIFSDGDQANATKAYEDWLAKTTPEY
jgi:hypothetical protein